MPRKAEARRGVPLEGTTTLHRRQASAWISDLRFRSFLTATHGDHHKAVALYMWHARMHAASFRTVHHFEVLLRNTVDARLGAGQPNAPLSSTWLLDPAVVQPEGLRVVRQVTRRLKLQGIPVERGQVVSALSFGFWRGLFGHEYERLWRQQLSHAFPEAGRRKRMSVPLTKLHQFRNRLAHHDSILQVNVAGRHAQMVQIATSADPRAGTWLERSSSMLVELKRKPS
jgi:hypothetical protein